MTNREFDRWLRDALSSVQPESIPGDWEDFVKRVEDEESGDDAGFDDAVRKAVATSGAGAIPDWDRMEQMLEADELAFDEQVKDSVKHYEAPYNPKTWPVLDARLAAEERTRQRLIAAKIAEIVAILFALITFYNFFPAIKSGVIDPAEDLLRKEWKNTDQPVTSAENADAEVVAMASTPAADAPVQSVETPVAGERVNQPNTSQPAAFIAGPDASNRLQAQLLRPEIPQVVTTQDDIPVVQEMPWSDMPVMSRDFGSSTAGLQAGSIPDVSTDGRKLSQGLAMILPGVAKSSKVRFGMSAGADVNTLFIPEEHFYSQGRSIRFSEKEIVAGGYTAGASLLFDSEKFLFETGLSYSSRQFGPDRKLFIGTSSDQHTVDFENITLNVISIPLYLHWKIDGKGLWRVYTIGGASMHVIANAHYDLIAENIFTSSAAPQDPMQLQNQREVQRVREHMLDGAKFSTKGYLTAVGGLGVERYLNPRTSLFLQPMYQYQIPFFGLIDQNGKHLRNGSLMLGTRISL